MTETRPAFTGPELCALEAHEVVAMLKRGDITPRDCIDAALARIARVEPAINAIPTLCEDRARAAADALESSAGNGFICAEKAARVTKLSFNLGF